MTSRTFELFGYVDSGYPGPGFRIPVFINDSILHLQEARGHEFNEKVYDYPVYNSDENPPVVALQDTRGYSAKFDPPHYYGRPCFVFLTGDEDNTTIFGTRDQIANRLRYVITADSSINPLLRLEILFFLAAPRTRLSAAIADGFEFLSQRNREFAELWRQEELKRLERTHSELKASLIFSRNEELVENIDLASIDRRLDSYEFGRIDEAGRLQRDVQSVRLLLADINSRDVSTASRCTRILLSIIARVDQILPPLDPLRIFARLSYARCCYILMSDHNRSIDRYRNDWKDGMDIEQRALERFSAGDSENLFRDILVLLSRVNVPRSRDGLLRTRSWGVAVVKHWDSGALNVGGVSVKIKDGLKPTVFFNSGLNQGDVLFVNALQEGVTARGREYVESFFGIFFPQSNSGDYEFFSGASNSWATVFMNPKSCTRILAGGGWVVRQITSTLGLRRLTVVKRNSTAGAHDPYERDASALRNFVASSWGSLLVEETGYYQCRIVANSLHIPGSGIVPMREVERFDIRKTMTFYSMLLKIFGDKFRIRFINRIGQVEQDIIPAVLNILRGRPSFFSSDEADIGDVYDEIRKA